jgi:hypothetical protein
MEGSYIAGILILDLGFRSLLTFTELRKTTISFVMCVCLSVGSSAWNNSDPTKCIFIKLDT